MLSCSAEKKVYGDLAPALRLPCRERLYWPVDDYAEEFVFLIDTHRVSHLLPVFTKRTTNLKRQIAHGRAMVEYYGCRIVRHGSTTRKNSRL
jgi:hypothetical protein